MTNIPFLDEDMSKVPTSRPLLPAGVYDLIIDEVKIEPGKTDPSKANLNVVFKTISPAVSTDNEALNPGFQVYHTISLTPTEKYPESSIKREIAKFLEGVEGAATRLHPIERFKGKAARVTLRIDDGNDKFDPSNRIKNFLKV